VPECAAPQNGNAVAPARARARGLTSGRATTLLLEWLEKPHATRGLRIAQTGGEWLHYSYVDLATDVRAFARSLQDTGAPVGSGVALLVAEPRQFITAFMGTLRAGMVPSPFATERAFRGSSRYISHLARVFTVAAPRVIVADEGITALAQDAARAAGIAPAFLTPEKAEQFTAEPDPAPRAPDELAVLQFTSGSSGNPKGVRVTWSSLEANLAAIRSWLKWNPDDVFATWLPLHHDMGLIGAMLTPVMSGTDLWIMTPEQFLREPLRWLECFGRHGATLTTSPSFGYAYASRRVSPDQLAGMDFSRWRVAILGAERIDPTAVARFSALVRPFGFHDTTLIGAYGLAEATLAVTGSPAETGSRLVRLAEASTITGAPVRVIEGGTLGVDHVGGGGWLVGCGQPLDGMRVEILDESGQPVPDGVFGEIRISGTSVAQGYVGADGAVTDFPAEGFATRDAGFVWENELYVLGRLADSLKVRGVTVYAEDLEAQLAQLDGLAPGGIAVVLGVVDGVDHAILLAEHDKGEPDWLDPAVARMRAALSADVEVVVLCGQRGHIERTSSGKPRRRVLWQNLVTGTARGWRCVHGTAPGPRSGDDAQSLLATGDAR
jgi:acyl-CoA synthetase (AMP-forming)/AMP-acid ligase II